MSEFVVVRLNDPERPVEWVMVDSNGARLSGRSTGDLSQLAGAVTGRELIVLIPSTDVLRATVNIPARSASKIRAALPFALEEDLAEDIDDMHFAVGDQQDNDRLPVIAVARSKMDEWLSRLNEAGLVPFRMLADIDGLPLTPGTLSMIVEDGQILFNDGKDQAFAMQDVKPSDVLVLAGELGEQQRDEVSGHLQTYCSQEVSERLEHDWIALRHELNSVDVTTLPDGALHKLAATVATGHGINLLQGDYGRKTDYAGVLRPWRFAAALALVLVVSAGILKGVSYMSLLNERSELQAQFTSVYRQIRPSDSQVISDPVGIVNSLRRSLGGGAAPQVFLPSLKEVAVALSANPGVDVDAISYRAGIVDLRLKAPNVSALDNIQKSISASGRYQATIQRTDQVGDEIDGRIQVREAGL